jgi:hypothetical protein
MNKFLNIIKIILFGVTIILNYLVWEKTRLVSWSHIFYLLLLIILFATTIKDLLKKNTINQNKTYQIISILVFIITIFILFRTLFDKLLLFNIKENEFEYYSMDFLKQNMIYFNTMLVVLLIYRKLNNKKISN